MKSPVFQPFPVIKTARLKLRALQEDDATFIYQLRTSFENAKFLDLPIPQNIDESEAYITRMQKGINANKHIYWVIERQEDKQLIGTICLWNFNLDSERVELGYELDSTAQRQGYMTETLQAIIDYATKTLGVRKVEAFTHEDNTASSRLLEKLQFRIVGYKNEIHSKTQLPYRFTIYSRSFD